jgi:hypothetical protein
MALEKMKSELENHVLVSPAINCGLKAKTRWNGLIFIELRTS